MSYSASSSKDNNIFASKQHARVYVTLCLAAMILLGLASWCLHVCDPTRSKDADWVTTAAPIIDSILATLCASLLVGVVIYYYRPKAAEGSGIVELRADEIPPAFASALASASTWIFLGNRGRYLRTCVLPSLANKSKDGGIFKVQAILMNPKNEAVINHFVTHHGIQGEVAAANSMSLKDEVISDIVATVIVSAFYNERDNLDVDIYLRDGFSPIRLDSNEQQTFLCMAALRKPALMISGGHFFNSWLLAHFSVKKNEAKSSKVALPKLFLDALDDVASKHVRIALSSLNMTVTDEQVSAIIKRTKDHHVPFQ